jgi:hypothetical protein
MPQEHSRCTEIFSTAHPFVSIAVSKLLLKAVRRLVQ